MGSALDDLIELLQLEQLEVNLFRGLSPDENRQRVFGGPGRGAGAHRGRAARSSTAHVHSLHAYFLRPGDPSIPIIYDVDRIRDGRSFTTRRVVAIQHGKAIFNLSASFHVLEPGPEHQYAMPDAPDPETLPTMRERLEPARRPVPDGVRRTGSGATGRSTRARPSCRAGSIRNRATRDAEQLVWFRADGTAARRPADARVHRGLRVGPHPARHGRDGARAFVGRRPLHDREPRPCDVVPPAAPRGRVAAVPPEQSVGPGRARARRRLHLPARRQRSR